MNLTATQRLAYRLIGQRLDPSTTSDPRLCLALQKAHMTIRPDVYIADTLVSMGLVFVSAALGIVIVAALQRFQIVSFSPLLYIFLVPIPLVLAVIVWLMAYLVPEMKAGNRARHIDARLPYALNYITTMASAGVTPQQTFATLAEQPLYGEVANEAAWISRDLELLGKDLLSALSSAIDRSPSRKFQDFLQGAITALTSGEDLRTYFLAKARQYVGENRQEQRRFMDTMGVLAESYVTVVVAAPLLLIILLTVMLMYGGDPTGMFNLGYALVFVLLPAAMAAFGLTIKYLTPEI